MPERSSGRHRPLRGRYAVGLSHMRVALARRWHRPPGHSRIRCRTGMRRRSVARSREPASLPHGSAREGVEAVRPAKLCGERSETPVQTMPGAAGGGNRSSGGATACSTGQRHAVVAAIRERQKQGLAMNVVGMRRSDDRLLSIMRSYFGSHEAALCGVASTPSRPRKSRRPRTPEQILSSLSASGAGRSSFAGRCAGIWTGVWSERLDIASDPSSPLPSPPGFGMTIHPDVAGKVTGPRTLSCKTSATSIGRGTTFVTAT